MDNHSEKNDGSEKGKKISDLFIGGIILSVIIPVAVGQIYSAAVFCHGRWGNSWEFQLGIGLFIWFFCLHLVELKETTGFYAFVNVILLFGLGYVNPILSGGSAFVWRLVCSELQKRS